MGCGASSSDANALAALPPAAEETTQGADVEDHGPAQSEPASSQGPQVDVTAEVGNRKDLMEEPVGQPYDLVESGSTAEIHCTVTTRPFFALFRALVVPPFLRPLSRTHTCLGLLDPAGRRLEI